MKVIVYVRNNSDLGQNSFSINTLEYKPKSIDIFGLESGGKNSVIRLKFQQIEPPCCDLYENKDVSISIVHVLLQTCVTWVLTFALHVLAVTFLAPPTD